MSGKRWVFDPDSGGKKIPENVKREVTHRIEKYAAEHYAGKYTRLDIRFRGQFCYIDAYTEPIVTDSWPPDDWPESREEYIERLRNTPPTYAVCVILAMINGASPFTPTAMKNMNYRCFPTENSLANQKMLLQLRQHIWSKVVVRTSLFGQSGMPARFTRGGS